MSDAPMCAECGTRRVSSRYPRHLLNGGHGRAGHAGAQNQWRKLCDRCRGNTGLQKLRPVLLKAANYSCIRCGFVAKHPAQLQLDHIVPTSCGGGYDDPENMQVLCANCHAYKTAVEDPLLRRQWTQLTLDLVVGPEQESMFR